MPTLTDLDRRRRLVERHYLGRTAPDVEAAIASAAATHSSDPATPYLACWARVPGFEVADLEDALYERRTLRRLHSIRRTLFVVPTEDVPMFQSAATMVRGERERLVGWISADMDSAAVGPWLERLTDQVVEALGNTEMSTKELTMVVPELATGVRVGSGKWAATVPLSTRLLFLLAMEGRLVRTRPAGSWRSSQYRWATPEYWNGGPTPVVGEEEARTGILRRYLASHGPVTSTDLRWWTGWTVKMVKEALGGLDVDMVELESGGEGVVLAGDVDPGQDMETTVALLPGLDSAAMGWKERDWYLGPHGDELFDRNGNAGPAVWVDGRMVGGWGQRPDGEVVYELLEPVDGAAVSLIEGEAGRLTVWLGGAVVMPRFPAPLGKRLSS